MKALRVIRSISGFCGFILLYLAISTSDYYVMELHAPEPQSVTVAMTVGTIMLLPALVSLIWEV